MEVSSTFLQGAAGARRAAVKISRPTLHALFSFCLVKFSFLSFRDLFFAGLLVLGVAQLQAQFHPSLERDALTLL